MCKSYTEQTEHKGKKFPGKSLDINPAFLKGKILSSCICTASGHIPTPKQLKNSNPTIVKHCEKSHTLLKM